MAYSLHEPYYAVYMVQYVSVSKLNIILTTGDINISFGIQNLWRGTHFGGYRFHASKKFGQNVSGTLSASDTNFVIYNSLYIDTEIFCSDS